MTATKNAPHLTWQWNNLNEMKLGKCVSSPRSSLSAAQLQNKTEQGHLEQLQLLTQGNWRKAIKRVVWRTPAALWVSVYDPIWWRKYSSFGLPLLLMCWRRQVFMLACNINPTANYWTILGKYIYIFDTHMRKYKQGEPKPDSSVRVHAPISVCVTALAANVWLCLCNKYEIWRKYRVKFNYPKHTLNITHSSITHIQH